MTAWERSIRDAAQPEWVVVQPAVDDISTGGREISAHARRIISGPGIRPDQAPRQTSRARTNLKTITAFRLELLNDAELPLNGPGRSIKGMGALSEFEVEVAPADAPSKVQRVTFARLGRRQST